MRLKHNILLLLLLVSFAGYGQRVHPIGGATNHEQALGKLSADSLLCAAGDTVSADYTTRTGFSRNRGLAVVNGVFMYFDSVLGWTTPATGAGGSVTVGQLGDSLRLYIAKRDSGRTYVSPYYFDSTYTYLIAVDGYLGDAIDSVAGLIPDMSGFATTVAVADSVSGRQKHSDTANYDASKAYVNNAIAGKLNSSDTAGLSARINLKLNSSDTAGLSTRVNLKLNATDTTGLSSRINLKQNFSDTSSWDATIAWVLGRNYTTQTALNDTAAAHLALIVGKQPQLNGNGFVKVSGTTVSYDNNTYLTTISGIAAGGDLTGTYPNPTQVTVNATPGTYGGSTAIPVIAVDSKGRATTITTSVVVAPAGTLTGSTLASGVTASSLTSLGTITSLNATTATVTTLNVTTVGSFPTLNQNTTGSAATLSPGRTINGTAFDGSANITVTAAPSGSAGGRLTGTYPNPTLAASGVSASTYGSATQTTTLTIAADGTISAAGNVTMTPAVGSITGLGTGVSTFLQTPSSANFLSALTGATGTGSVVASASPTLTGSPVAPTQSAGDNSTKIATTAYVDGAGFITPSSTTTLTNKRWTARVGSTTSSATPSINTDLYDIYEITALAVDITSLSTNLTGTPVNGDILELRITGTATRNITTGASFVNSSKTAPTATNSTATLTLFYQYYTTSSYGNNKWVFAGSY
jgi:hypothetical protein